MHTNPSNEARTGSFPDPHRGKIRLPTFMPFFWMGLAAFLGPLAAEEINFPWYWWAILAGLFVLLSLLQKQAPAALQTIRHFPFSLALAAFALAAMLYQLRLPQATPDHLLYYHNKGQVRLTGVVTQPPETAQSTVEVVLQTESLRAEELAVHEPEIGGKVLFYLPLGSDYQYGDRLEVKGELQTPEEGVTFSWKNYLKHQGIYSTIAYPKVKLVESGQGNPLLAALFNLRDRGNQVLMTIFPSPEDALLRGILLGDESGISPALETAYQRTGTSHIIAISGFNMAVLAGIISLFFTRQIGNKRGALATIIFLVVYSLLVGANPPVLRAAFMASYAVLASTIARKGNILNNLGVSALIMILLDTHLPWDIGFQFSLASTLGLALFASPLLAKLEDWFATRFEKERALQLSALLSEVFLLTLIAQVMTLPLIVWHFREASWLFLVANPLILPVQPTVMVLGLLALVGGLLSISLGSILAWLAWPWAAWTNQVVLWLSARAPETWIVPRFSFFWVLLFYALLFLLAFRPKLNKLTQEFLKPRLVLPALAAVTLVVWLIYFSAPDGKLHIHLPNEKDKSMILLELEQGQSVLLAGSSGEDSVVDLVSDKLPLFSRNLDTLIIPSCQRSTISGLFVLANKMEIGQVLWACDPQSSQTSRNLYENLEQKGIPQHLLGESDLLIGEDFKLALLKGEKESEGLLLEHGKLAWKILPTDSQEEESLSNESETHLPIIDSEAFSLYLSCQGEACLVDEESFSTNTNNSTAPWTEIVSDGVSFWLNAP